MNLKGIGTDGGIIGIGAIQQMFLDNPITTTIGILTIILFAARIILTAQEILANRKARKNDDQLG